MSSTEGSPTCTGWKRRSRAASFSMCLRYSLSVVAPMQRNCAAGQRRLEQVGRVDGALGRAGADQRVQLVDEQDDPSVRLLDLLQHGLEPVLELAAVLRTGDHRAQVERDERPVLQASPARRRRRSVGPVPRRWRSCPRRGRRSGPGCSSSGDRAPASCVGSRRLGRSPGRACPGGPARSGPGRSA